MSEERSEAGELARRVERLERANRLLVRALAVALGLGLFVLLVQVLAAVRPEPTALDARELLVRDLDGRVRARLAVREEGGPELSLVDADGLGRAHLGLGAEGAPSLVLRSGDGRIRAGFALLPDGRPQVALLGPPGVSSVLLGVAPGEAGGESAGGSGLLLLRDAQGANAFQAP